MIICVLMEIEREDSIKTTQAFQGHSLNFILDSFPHGVQESDLNGIITYSNPAHHKMLGYESGELIGKSIFELVAPAEKESLKQYIITL